MYLANSRIAARVLGVGLALWLGVAGAAGAETAEAKSEQRAGSTALSAPVAEAEGEKALLERARAYWDFRAEASTKVYEFYPPDVQASGRLPAEFAGVYYEEYQIEYVVAEGDRGLVVVQAQQLLDPTLAARLEGEGHRGAPEGARR